MITITTVTSSHFSVPVVSVNKDLDIAVNVSGMTLTMSARTAEQMGRELISAYHQAIKLYEDSQSALNAITNQTIKHIDGRKWLIRTARSMEDALDAIAHASVTGSVGSKTRVDDRVVADVVVLNTDGSERKPG